MRQHVYCIYLMYAPPLLTIHYTCSCYGHNMSNVYTRYPTTNSSQVVSVNVIDMWLPLSPRRLCLSVCLSVHGWHICVLGISLNTNHALYCASNYSSLPSFTQVTLQFPDFLLRDSTWVVEQLALRCPSAQIYILGDTSYGR